jgi:hypothetical protein
MDGFRFEATPGEWSSQGSCGDWSSFPDVRPHNVREALLDAVGLWCLDRRIRLGLAHDRVIALAVHGGDARLLDGVVAAVRVRRARHAVVLAALAAGRDAGPPCPFTAAAVRGAYIRSPRPLDLLAAVVVALRGLLERRLAGLAAILGRRDLNEDHVVPAEHDHVVAVAADDPVLVAAVAPPFR